MALLQSLNELTRFHTENCESYGRIVRAVFPEWSGKTIDKLPYLPVSIFKTDQLKSITDDNVFKVLTSSGTTGSAVSKIYLDADTAKSQTRALAEIMQQYLGRTRRPMLIIDNKSVIKDRKQFSARGAGILGMLNFGRQHFYALNDDMTLDVEGVTDWLSKVDSNVLVFGFTFMVWKYFLNVLEENPSIRINFRDAILIHSGGWKKLIDQAVTNDDFKRTAHRLTQISKVHNFYGMVEQVGSVYVECEEGFFHTPKSGSLIIRDPGNWENAGNNASGVIQVFSMLPKSYPGHSLLTEDQGTIFGQDDCKCGRAGKYFLVHGRLPTAELRGCSDTHQG